MKSPPPFNVSITGKIVQPVNKRHGDRQFEASRIPGGRLFHYTTTPGLQGIVESNSLHASAAYFLNDSSEVEYGKSILADVLDKWELNNPEQRDDPTAELVRDLRTQICGAAGREALVQSVYVVCFCERDNLLNQWRYYGKDGGYSIGFPIDKGYIPGLAPESPSFTTVLTRVEYERAKQVECCEGVLNSILPFLEDPTVTRTLHTDMALTYHGKIPVGEFIFKVAQEWLIDELLSFKDKAFEEEKEWRLIARPRLFRLQGRDDRGKTPNKFYFRPHRGLLIPYIKLMPLSGKLPVASIRSGPSINVTKAEASIRLMMRQHGFADIDFRGSAIPVII